MISTVTSATAVLAANERFADMSGLLAVLFFLVLLMHREVLGAARAGWTYRLAQGLIIPLLPLAVVFATVVVARLLQAFR